VSVGEKVKAEKGIRNEGNEEGESLFYTYPLKQPFRFPAYAFQGFTFARLFLSTANLLTDSSF
jgi:hypothetical protein